MRGAPAIGKSSTHLRGVGKSSEIRAPLRPCAELENRLAPLSGKRLWTDVHGGQALSLAVDSGQVLSNQSFMTGFVVVQSIAEGPPTIVQEMARSLSRKMWEAARLGPRASEARRDSETVAPRPKNCGAVSSELLSIGGCISLVQRLIEIKYRWRHGSRPQAPPSATEPHRVFDRPRRPASPLDRDRVRK